MCRRLVVIMLVAFVFSAVRVEAFQTDPAPVSASPSEPPPMPKSKPEPTLGLKQLRIEVPPELLKSSVCTPEDWRRIRTARRRGFVSLYIVGPLVSLGLSSVLYRVDRQLTPGDLGMSIGVGAVVGGTFGATFLSSANRRQLNCMFPR